MNPTPATPCVRVHLLDGRFPEITTLPSPDEPWTDVHQQAWHRLCEANPRHHDGPIWSACSISAAGISVAPERYRRLAIQSDPAVGDLGVRLLGVKGLTTDSDGRTLIARRGSGTRLYAGLWEIAPAGGVNATGPLTLATIIETLVQEAAEELDADVAATASGMVPLMLLQDEIARSVDVVMSLKWPGQQGARERSFEPNWEYTERQWLTAAQTGEWVNDRSSELTPPTQAVLEALQQASFVRGDAPLGP